MKPDILLTYDDALATVLLLAQRHVNRLGDRVEAAYRDGRCYARQFPEKAAYERAMSRLGNARAALA